MYEEDSNRNLRKLAAGNETRERVVAGRKERASTRARYLECRLCLTSDYSLRDKTDICAQCVVDQWRMQDVARAAEATGDGNGMTAINFPEPGRSHDLPHPHFGGDRIEVPADAVFSRRRYDRHETSPSSIMQTLYQEILDGLGAAYPVPPEQRRSTTSFLARGDLYAMIPTKTMAALLDLWHFVPWLTHAVDESAYERGNSLIQGLVLGTHTVQDFNSEVAKQTEHIRRAREKSANGVIAR